MTFLCGGKQAEEAPCLLEKFQLLNISETKIKLELISDPRWCFLILNVRKNTAIRKCRDSSQPNIYTHTHTIDKEIELLNWKKARAWCEGKKLGLVHSTKLLSICHLKVSRIELCWIFLNWKLRVRHTHTHWI